MEWYAGFRLNNRYELIRKLGFGGFGEVWLTWNHQSDRNVAIKRLLRLEHDHIERFGREVRILWRLLDKPGVVDILDMHFELPTPFFVMEFCEGGSLRQFASKANAWRQVVEMLQATSQTLGSVHAQGGFHRDIKPDNLLLPELGAAWGSVKIADFGLARVPTTASGPITRHPCGTPFYMAPELKNGGTFNASADVFSLGMTALELLTGTLAPSSLDDVQVPGELRQLVRRMIDYNPTLRPAMETVASSAMNLLFPQMPAQPAPARPAVAQPGRRAGLFETVLGAFAVAAAGVGVAMLAGAATRGFTNGGKDDSDYDPSVDRYRGPDGRFRRGPFGS